MLVRKRDGRLESVKFEKISDRIEKLCYGLNKDYVKTTEIAKKVINGLYDGVSTEELDELAAEETACMTSIHPDFSKLAARIAISNLHKTTYSSFTNTMKLLYEYVNPETNEYAPLIAKSTYGIIRNHAKMLDDAIDYQRDYEYDYFGFKTLENSYLLKINNKIKERPQHMLMRVAVGIHGEDIKSAIETYHLMSEKWFIHATPTLFNAGTPKPQLSSCFLLSMREDSIEGIYDTLKQCAKISQSAGGIGLSIHDVRAKGSYIKGTNGKSNGIVPMLRNFDMTARYVDQGGGRRKGSFAVYLEPWHADIFAFLDLKKNHGKEELRARDLFYALWIPDLFMERTKNNDEWSLFCPNECPGLDEVYGKEFETLYKKYEKEGRQRKTIKAQELWKEIVTSQIETGTPYMLYKDAANKKSNQKNLGTIKSSNLCTEIMEYTSKDEVAVCNLASISLPNFVIDGKFDHQKLYKITQIVTKNLNKIININYYPIKEAHTSNMRHRPIGIGVQGLADAFLLMKLAYTSQEARILNKEIFETIYYAAMEASMKLAQKEGPYSTYEGSPASKGIFQFDMWDVTPDSNRWDWDKLKKAVKKHGIRNSLLVAPMPTASTSQILGNNECFDPYNSNLYQRRVKAGEFIVINKHLMNDLIPLRLWNDKILNKIKINHGSIQTIREIPQEIRERYKTVWEIPQKVMINMAADRGAYICQSQSMSLYLEDTNYSKMTSMHFYGWSKGLKTGMYYLRSRPAANAIQFTVEKQETLKINTQTSSENSTDNNVVSQCSIDNMEDHCEMCGS